MTFNPMMGYAVVRFRDLLPKAPSVIELGSQTLTIRVSGHPKITTVPEFYEHLGFERYDSIDFNGKGTILDDLNTTSTPKDDLRPRNQQRHRGAHIQPSRRFSELSRSLQGRRDHVARPSVDQLE